MYGETDLVTAKPVNANLNNDCMNDEQIAYVLNKFHENANIHLQPQSIPMEIIQQQNSISNPTSPVSTSGQQQIVVYQLQPQMVQSNRCCCCCTCPNKKSCYIWYIICTILTIVAATYGIIRFNDDQTTVFWFAGIIAGAIIALLLYIFVVQDVCAGCCTSGISIYTFITGCILCCRSMYNSCSCRCRGCGLAGAGGCGG